MEAALRFDAIVLCGGAARRLDGTDKGALVVGGRALLERALDAVKLARTTIVVGPQRRTSREVSWALERPPGSGPVAAIAAGLQVVQEPVCVVLGVDFPFVTSASVERILSSLGEEDGVILRDETGRHQFLVGVYKTDVLRKRLEGTDPRNMAVKELIEDLDILLIDDPRSTRDCDTWEDVHSIEELLSKESVPRG